MAQLLKTREEVLEFRKNLPSHFCPVPFTTIIFEPDGLVGVCRAKGHVFPIGNLGIGSIREIWNSPKAMKWREEFLKKRT